MKLKHIFIIATLAVMSPLMQAAGVLTPGQKKLVKKLDAIKADCVPFYNFMQSMKAKGKCLSISSKGDVDSYKQAYFDCINQYKQDIETRISTKKLSANQIDTIVDMLEVFRDKLVVTHFKPNGIRLNKRVHLSDNVIQWGMSRTPEVMQQVFKRAQIMFEKDKDLSSDLRMLIQNRVCCRKAKGFDWEVLGALLLSTMHKPGSDLYPKRLGYSLGGREFDIMTKVLLIELKDDKLLTLSYDDVEEGSKEAIRSENLEKQFSDGYSIAKNNGKGYIILSKNELSDDWLTYLDTKRIAVIDPTNQNRFVTIPGQQFDSAIEAAEDTELEFNAELLFKDNNEEALVDLSQAQQRLSKIKELGESIKKAQETSVSNSFAGLEVEEPNSPTSDSDHKEESKKTCEITSDDEKEN